MTSRWQLNRAGIINVYQYVDETLHFGGGRLLLRGVNGSGKSTAMNMLLPFLLDADTRRIDAAGEQSAVLRSWMLSGRDEAQPIGYLWLEFELGAGATATHLVCGCGIKANRSTDRVTTWWFLTDRRPGIDLALVDGNVPLGPDALRAELGGSSVFAHEQRNAYRQAVRARLFGGQDIDQHLRLLHVVRNPRVGDRIDTELPAYLDDALPQLSEAALNDAAQPLEDLDEHRRNVADLKRTATTLEALAAVYQTYAASELRTRAKALVSLADEVAARQRTERRCLRDAETATAALADLRTHIADLHTAVERLSEEIAALEASTDYQQGRALDDLRAHVDTLRAAAVQAHSQAERTDARRRASESEARAAADAAHGDLDHLRATTSEVKRLVSLLKLATRVPDLPAIADSSDEAAHGVPRPTPDLALDPARMAVAALRAQGAQRRMDIADVAKALDQIDRRTEDLARNERDRDRADGEAVTASDRLTTARTLLADDLRVWRDALRAWIADLESLDSGYVLSAADPTLYGLVDLLDRRDQVQTEWTAAAQRLADHHRSALAEVRQRRTTEQVEIERLETVLADLQRRTYPEPPAGAWQRADRRTRLADCIDFADGLGDEERAGLEAAMEASGLLGAEIGGDGTLRADTGELLVLAGTPETDALSRLLVTTIPDALAALVSPVAIERILASISTRPGSGAATMVATDGSFHVGALRGRHHKAEAEHIGTTARRAAIDRQRAEATALVTSARQQLVETDQQIMAVTEQRDAAIALHTAFPPSRRLTDAMLDIERATEWLAEAQHRLDAARLLVTTAEAARAEAITATDRLAFTHQLPVDRSGLKELDTAAAELTHACRQISDRIDQLLRTHRAWQLRVSAWTGALEDHQHAVAAADQAGRDLSPQLQRLTTLQDAIGTAYADVLARRQERLGDLAERKDDRATAEASKEAIVRAEEGAARDAKAAGTDRDAAERRCLAALAPMRRTLLVPGLLDAARAGQAPRPFQDVTEQDRVADLPTVLETSAGVRELADAILKQIAAPDRTPVTADGVRQSLRQRRDQLGAGWDAEDQQPDEMLPLSVQVTGPSGRLPLMASSAQVRAQLVQQSSLLTVKQDQALRNLLQGLVAKEVAHKMHAASDLVRLMNKRLDRVTTAHGIGAKLTWKRKAELDQDLNAIIELLARPPDLRTADEDALLSQALSARIEQARQLDPERRYRDLIVDVLDYRRWHEMSVLIRRPGRNDERLTRRTPLSEGEKKIVSYLPLFAAVAASYDALAERASASPRFLLLDDAFAKVSEDNHPQLFGLLVAMDLDFIATSERLWGTHATVPALAITEVLRDATLGVIVLEHSRWDGTTRSEPR